MPSKNHRMLELSLSILESAAARREGMSVSDVYTQFAIPRSSASIILHTFANMGYMTRDKAGFFHIGPKAFEIGARFTENDGNYSFASGVLDELVAKTDETAHMGILNGSDVIYVCKSECSHAIRMISQIGKHVPAHATAVGKALLSMKTDGEVRDLYAEKPLTQLTPHTIVYQNMLIDQLYDIRRSGFATEEEESTEGVTCIAIPLRGKANGNMAAISISVPVIRLNDGLDRFKKPLQEAGQRIQSVL